VNTEAATNSARRSGFAPSRRRRCSAQAARASSSVTPNPARFQLTKPMIPPEAYPNDFRIVEKLPVPYASPRVSIPPCRSASAPAAAPKTAPRRKRIHVRCRSHAPSRQSAAVMNPTPPKTAWPRNRTPNAAIVAAASGMLNSLRRCQVTSRNSAKTVIAIPADTACCWNWPAMSQGRFERLPSPLRRWVLGTCAASTMFASQPLAGSYLWTRSAVAGTFVNPPVLYDSRRPR